MTIEEWGIVIGVVTSAILALAPWMFMVHAKLAVLTIQMGDVEDKVDRLIEANEQRLQKCAAHAARLDTHEVQLSHVADRLQDH
ncbi:MAG: hypothetical protein ACYTG0_02950 [Planctomycetota bacterium]|jgi:hypothetical protein